MSLDLQIYDKPDHHGKPKYYRNNIPWILMYQFLADCYLKLPEIEQIDIQVFDMNIMPLHSIEAKTYWEAIDQINEYYIQIEESQNQEIINEKICQNLKDSNNETI